MSDSSLERWFLTGFEDVINQKDIPDYEVTEVASVHITFTLNNGAVVNYDFDTWPGIGILAAMRVLFGEKDKNRMVMQLMLASTNARVKRTGHVIRTFFPWGE